MSNSRGLRRALSPKRSLRLESQGSEGSGLNRLSFTGSRKRTRKHSKLQTTGAAHDIDPQAFLEEWKITPQEEVRFANFTCKHKVVYQITATQQMLYNAGETAC